MCECAIFILVLQIDLIYLHLIPQNPLNDLVDFPQNPLKDSFDVPQTLPNDSFLFPQTHLKDSLLCFHQVPVDGPFLVYVPQNKWKNSLQLEDCFHIHVPQNYILLYSDFRSIHIIHFTNSNHMITKICHSTMWNWAFY